MVGEPANRPDASTSTGVALATASYLMWGGFPIYFKAVAEVPAIEVLAHRIVWSVLFVAAVLAVGGEWRRLLGVLGDRRALCLLALSTTLICLNWGVFIWAVSVGRVMESSLGYFINPLVSVALGVAILGERLGRVQWIAIALAAAGVGYLALATGSLPWVSLTLAVTFGAYGLVRKVVPVGSVMGLFIETAIATPVALTYLVTMGVAGEGVFGRGPWSFDALLAAAGVITAVPLLLFVAGARRIRLSTLGLLQYIVPTAHFLLAVGVFGEPFTQDRAVAFGFIWVALALYTVDSMSQRRVT